MELTNKTDKNMVVVNRKDGRVDIYYFDGIAAVRNYGKSHVEVIDRLCNDVKCTYHKNFVVSIFLAENIGKLTQVYGLSLEKEEEKINPKKKNWKLFVEVVPGEGFTRKCESKPMVTQHEGFTYFSSFNGEKQDLNLAVATSHITSYEIAQG